MLLAVVTLLQKSKNRFLGSITDSSGAVQPWGSSGPALVFTDRFLYFANQPIYSQTGSRSNFRSATFRNVCFNSLEYSLKCNSLEHTFLY